MTAVAKNPAFAKKVGIKQSVGEEFIAADKGKKFGTGGNVNYSYGGKDQANKKRTRFGSSFGYKLNAPDANNDKYAGLKTGGAIRTDLQKSNKKETDHGQSKLFKEGGKAMKHDDIKQDKPMMKQIAGIEATKIVNKHEKKMHGMKKGGCVSMCRGGGIEIKGKTKGRMV